MSGLDVLLAVAGLAVTVLVVAGMILITPRGEVDVFGYQLGARITAELAIARPQQVRRVMLWGAPCYSPQERAGLLQAATTPGTREDGGDVVEEWQRMLQRKGANSPPAALAEELGDRLRAGASGTRALAAAIEYPTLERLPLVKQPALVLRLRDESWDQSPRVRAALPAGSMLDIPDYGQGFLSAAPQRFASIAREFLDR